MLVGYRAYDDATHDILGTHVRETAIEVLDLADVRELGASAAGRRAVAQFGRGDLDGVWLDLDVDVLDDALMPAVDYREPDGLLPREVIEIVQSVAAMTSIVGMEVTIYNPTLDPDGACAAEIVDLVARSLGSAQSSPRVHTAWPTL